jgi:predicted ATPase
MPIDCGCHEPHERRRIVLTGGPGAGKTAVLETLKHSLCRHIVILPESASIVFGGGFPRMTSLAGRQASQRAIFFVQRELELLADSTDDFAIVLCDRGLVDSAAYWPGPDEIWPSVGMARKDALSRYDAVIHLRVPDAAQGYGHQNPLRVESPEEAAVIDERILRAWDGHPRRFVIEATSGFLAKATRAIEIIRDEVPECCRDHIAPRARTG